MLNEILIYFGCTRSVANDFSNALQNDMSMSLYEWNGLFEAGDEDGTVWRAEFVGDIEDVKEIPVMLIQNIASNFKLKLASISLYNGEEEPFELFVDEDFVYCK